MNVLITGAGLVGCHAALLLTEAGHQAVLYDIAPNRAYTGAVAPGVDVIQGDVRDMPSLIDALRRCKAEVVVHTAFLIGQRINEHPHAGMSTNIDGAMALAEAARLSGVRRLLFASTFGIYRWDLSPSEPIGEDFPIGGERFYAASKIACERILAALPPGTGWSSPSSALPRFTGQAITPAATRRARPCTPRWRKPWPAGRW